MIVSALTGGLGNQMFQYAFGRCISIKNKTSLKIHFVNALFNTARQYDLDKFNIKCQKATNEDLSNAGVFRSKVLNRVAYLIDERLGIQFNKSIVTQKYPYKFEKKYLKIRDNSYIQGFWNDERYFGGIEGYLRKEFTLKNKLDSRNDHVVKKIKSVNSISVHIRRGDYVSNIRNLYLYTKKEYFINSMRSISNKISKPVFYFFSDDIAWCRKNFSSLNYKMKFIEHNTGENSYLDLHLMSNCKHNIIANSTFSWWASWLNKNPKKIIIKPF